MIPQPSAQLLPAIMACIAREQRRRAFLSAGALVCSISAFIISFSVLFMDTGTSGIVTYLELLFTDPDAIALFATDFSFLVLESLPAVTIAAVAGALACVLASVRFFVRTVRPRSNEALQPL